MKKISLESSFAFYSLKAIAVLTIFFAHMPIVYDGGNSINLIYSYLGMTGVPIFLMMAGFFEFGSRSSFAKKAKSLFLPLLIWGSASFLVKLFFSFDSFKSIGDIVYSWFKWVYGSGTWFYFVPVLFWCKVLNSYDNIVYQISLSVLSVISISLSSLNLIPYEGFFTPYINPFNFYVYFQLGYWIRKYDFDFCNIKVFLGSVFLFLTTILVWDTTPSYFSCWCIPYSISSFVILYKLSTKVNNHLLVSIGKISFVIYLSHLIVTGVIERRIVPFLINTPFEFIKVLVAFIIVAGLVYFFKIVFEKYHFTKLLSALGYR